MIDRLSAEAKSIDLRGFLLALGLAVGLLFLILRLIGTSGQYGGSIY